MRNSFTVIILLCLSLQSCFYNVEDDDFTPPDYEPITESRATLQANITLENPRAIINQGKIYAYNDLLFVIEARIGIHIFDNTDNLNPVATGFIPVSGITDIAIRNDIVLLHHYTDLLAFNYNHTARTFTLQNVNTSVFPALEDPYGRDASFYNVPSDQIIIDYNRI